MPQSIPPALPSAIPQVPRTGFAVWALVLGILSICGLPFLSIPAVILGHLALRRSKREPNRFGGGGLAVGGLVTGYMGLALTVIVVLVLTVVFRFRTQLEELESAPFAMDSIEVPEFPEPGDSVAAGNQGVTYYDVICQDDGPGGSMQMRVYLPEGEFAPETLPCVLVAPAGTNLLSGASLEGSDYHDETLPYAEAGMVVVQYSLDGHAPEDPDTAVMAMEANYEAFTDAGAGVVNGRNALEYALEELEVVDPERIYAAGHSSSGTLSLLMAAHEPRLAGALSYAPACDVYAMHRELTEEVGIGLILPGLKVFLKRSSPITHADKVTMPIFLFFSQDDMTASIDDAKAYRFALEEHGGEITFQTVPSGGHYYPMIERGIPAGIEWIQSR